MTAKPLSCIKSRPVRDLSVPVAKKNSSCLPTTPVYRLLVM